MGRSDNPRYVPIVDVFVENKEQLKTVLRHASRLKNVEFDGVFYPGVATCMGPGTRLQHPTTGARVRPGV